MSIGGAGQRCRSEGAHVQPLVGVHEALHVTLQLEDVGHQMEPERHGLGVLHVGETGHHGGLVPLRLHDQDRLEPDGVLHAVQYRVAHEHAQVGDDLVVTAPAGVQFAPASPIRSVRSTSMAE